MTQQRDERRKRYLTENTFPAFIAAQLHAALKEVRSGLTSSNLFFVFLSLSHCSVIQLACPSHIDQDVI